VIVLHFYHHHLPTYRSTYHHHYRSPFYHCSTDHFCSLLFRVDCSTVLFPYVICCCSVILPRSVSTIRYICCSYHSTCDCSDAILLFYVTIVVLHLFLLHRSCSTNLFWSEFLFHLPPALFYVLRSPLPPPVLFYVLRCSICSFVYVSFTFTFYLRSACCLRFLPACRYRSAFYLFAISRFVTTLFVRYCDFAGYVYRLSFSAPPPDYLGLFLEFLPAAISLPAYLFHHLELFICYPRLFVLPYLSTWACTYHLPTTHSGSVLPCSHSTWSYHLFWVEFVVVVVVTYLPLFLFDYHYRYILFHYLRYLEFYLFYDYGDLPFHLHLPTFISHISFTFHFYIYYYILFTFTYHSYHLHSIRLPHTDYIPTISQNSTVAILPLPPPAFHLELPLPFHRYVVTFTVCSVPFTILICSISTAPLPLTIYVRPRLPTTVIPSTCRYLHFTVSFHFATYHRLLHIPTF